MMKSFFSREKDLFIPALVLSVSIHGLLIGVGGRMSSAPEVSIIEAPSSLEITVISRPVVTVIEEEIVFEEVVEEIAEEIVLRGRVLSFGSRESSHPLAVSRESQGAATKAKPLTYVNPAPPYPRVARQRGWEGVVRIKVLVGKDGAPSQVGIQESSGHGILDRTALKTVEKWKFSPAKSGFLKFSSRITVPIRFMLVRE